MKLPETLALPCPVCEQPVAVPVRFATRDEYRTGPGQYSHDIRVDLELVDTNDYRTHIQHCGELADV